MALLAGVCDGLCFDDIGRLSGLSLDLFQEDGQLVVADLLAFAPIPMPRGQVQLVLEAFDGFVLVFQDVLNRLQGLGKFLNDGLQGREIVWEGLKFGGGKRGIHLFVRRRRPEIVSNF